MPPPLEGEAARAEWLKGIPVRNLWVLFLYAADLARFEGRRRTAMEPGPDDEDLLVLVARVLNGVVRERLRRSLSWGYRATRADLPRVRGRIDILRTESHLLLQRGRVACRYDELAADTPRNRLARAALVRLSRRLPPSARSPLVSEEVAGVAGESRRLARVLGSLGVRALRPTPAELAADLAARPAADDLLMASLARAVFDLLLPSEEEGERRAPGLLSEKRFWRIYEKAIANFYRFEYHGRGWSVDPQPRLDWPLESGGDDRMPAMRPDVVLRRAGPAGRVVVVDAKSYSMWAERYGREKARSGNLYQMYAYLRTQEERGAAWRSADGVLLHPVADPQGREETEDIRAQGHRVRFATVDLARPRADIESRLRWILTGGAEGAGAAAGRRAA